MRYRASSANGELPCGIEVNTMPKKGKRKTNKKQRPDILAWITRLAAAAFWVLRLFFLLWDRFSR